jgi:L-rhamnose-H+ transport protein
MHTVLGIIFHTIGGVASGSFYMPFQRVKGWAWETYWLTGGLFSWLLLPLLAAWLTIPDFTVVIAQADGGVKLFVFLMGLLWGIGGLTYGLGVRYLGMSLGNSIVLSFCAAFGALVPAIYYAFRPAAGKTSISDMLQNSGGQLVLLGVATCLAGIGMLGKAGMMKERELSIAQKKASTAEFNLSLGIVLAIISGVLSSFFNFGIEGGKPIAEAAVRAGGNTLFQHNVTYVVLLWGGLATNLVWCIFLNFRNRSFSDYLNTSVPLRNNLLFSGIAGTLWFLQFFFYGMGESRLGNGAGSWILHMATIILTANLWGLWLKEWNGLSKATFRTFLIGILTVLASIVLVGIGNTLK